MNKKHFLITGIILFAATAIYELIWLIPFLLNITEFNGVHFILTGVFAILSTSFIYVGVKTNKIIKAIYVFYLIVSIAIIVLGILNLCGVWTV